ncbi:sirohydrochlorin cobaltochelatase [Desulfovibrio inopinatus]|uniref:sirohydrochlorin cobaltochelatase n=1 Tax=Desulfovibrio inopinatus TaxID=102109 RepID=UPI0004811F8D|nr:sirohydrochlorin cobaltochelatase [Desulfovibrio inopinatus]
MFQRLFSTIILLLILCAFPTMQAYCGHDGPKQDKPGILVVAFGTTMPTAEKALQHIEGVIKKTFPNVPVRMAYSSKIVRAKIAREQHRNIASPAEALAQMKDENFTHVAVQSLHSIPGEEYHNLLKTAYAFPTMGKSMQQVVMGMPLMATSTDLEKVADAIMACLPADRKPNEAIVLMGHGTHHPADVYYAALQYHLAKRDPNIFVGTVEGFPTLDDVIEKLKKNGLTKAWLMPLMSVAGDHANNDMAGDEPDSWKSILDKNGITSVPVLTGLADYDQLVAIWVDHLKTAYSQLNIKSH